MTGVLLVDKPAGCTSHDVVARVRQRYGIRRVGHTGTLDPFATGLLVVLLGPATRVARLVEQQAKTYLASARLDFGTTTDDLTGEALPGEGAAREPTDEELTAALTGLVGPQRQRPPAYSAKKVAGERAYARARRGETVALAPVPITVHRLDLVRRQWPLVEFRATVSPGTYLRALARDLAHRLGSPGGHLTALRREAIGPLTVAEATPLDRLGPDVPLQSVRTALGHLPAHQLSPAERQAVGHGRAIAAAAAAGEAIVLLDGEAVVAVAQEEGGWLKPMVVLLPA